MTLVPLIISLCVGLIPPSHYLDTDTSTKYDIVSTEDQRDRSFPEVFDWREMGGVTPARDQGFVDCYPCWAFCLIAAVESAVAIESGYQLDLSEQQLLDCNQEGYGCEGGWLDGWTILRDYGAVSESCYPYLGHNQLCAHHTCEPVARVTGCQVVGDNIDDIKDAVMNHAPVACGMTVYNDFSFYKEGCYRHDGNDMFNHGVVIVGWDDTACDGNGAWIVKNSFGPDWGEDGYIYMEYGTCRIGAGSRYFEVEVYPETLVYELKLEDRVLETGDHFLLERQCYIPGDASIEASEYIVLSVGGEYFVLSASENQVMQAGQWSSMVVCDFIWPEIPRVGAEMMFAGCILNPDSYDIVSFDVIGAEF